MKCVRKLSVCFLLLCLVAGGTALAQTSNYWIGTTGGDYTNTANWAGGLVPGTSDWPFFTNGTAQTITFSKSVTNGTWTIYDTSLTFDMSGYRWDQMPNSGTMGTNGGAPMTLTFSSSSAPVVGNGNIVNIGNASPSWSVPAWAPNVSMVVDDSLGYPVRIDYAGGLAGSMNGPLIVEGTNSQFRITYPNSGLGVVYAPVLVTNKAVFGFFNTDQTRAIQARTVTVVNATMDNSTPNNGDFWIGSGSRAGVVLRNDSLWLDSRPIRVGASGAGGGDILIDDSTFVGQSIELGSGSADGRLEIVNGSSATFSNRVVVNGFTTRTNLLVLNNGTISLGGGSVPGVLTNRGVMRAAGTIKGIGSSPALVRNERSLEIGSSIGTLNLVNANLELAAGSQTLFEFSDTGLDQIIMSGGAVSLLGSNLFSLASGSATPVPGVPWGLRAYDFVVGENVTWNPQYQDLTNVLAGYGLVQGLDYNFGVVGLDGGLQALRLEFVPEPSTVLLLVGGGLLLWRVRRKKQ